MKSDVYENNFSNYNLSENLLKGLICHGYEYSSILQHSILSKDIKKILQKVEPLNTQFSDPNLLQTRLELMFNTHIIECLEARFCERNRLSAPSAALNPGSISKTAPQAG